jgi:hemerythrin-like domain-containing protein
MGTEAETTGTFNIDSAKKAVEFIQYYADKHHHEKEENILFTLMQNHHFTLESGPLAAMMHDHESGRILITKISNSLDKISQNENIDIETKSFAENVRTFNEVLSLHIQKEDNVLYAMAVRALTANEMIELKRLFDKYEMDAEARGVQRKFVQIANELTNIYGVGTFDKSFECPGGCCH